MINSKDYSITLISYSAKDLYAIRTGNCVHVRMMLVISLLLLTSFSFSKDFKALNEEADDETFFRIFCGRMG